MKEVSAPVIGIALILSAVFVPVAFIGGLTGPDVPAVRADDRDLGAALGVQRAVALARRSARCCSSPPKPTRGPLGQVLPRVQQGVRRDDERLRELVARCSCGARSLTIVIVVRRGRRRRRSSAARSRRASCPTRTRASSASTSSCRRRVARADRARCSRRSRRCSERPRASSRTRRSAATASVTNTYQPEVRHHLRARSKPWESGTTTRAARQRRSWRRCRRALAAHPGGRHLPVQHPDHLRLRRGGRLQLPAPGPKRHDERRGARRADAGASSTRARQRPELAQPVHVVRPARTRRSSVELDREKARKLGRAGQRGVPGAVGRDGRQPT